MIKIILVRHAETFGNRDNIIQGHNQGQLTPKGFEQAKKLAQHIKDEQIDKIYVSDLMRTVQTASEIIKLHPEATVIYDERIRERNYGEFEGKTGIELGESVKKSGLTRGHFKPINGESWMEVYARAGKFLKDVIAKDDGKTILIVSHGGIVRNSVLNLLNEQMDDFSKYRHDNTGISVLIVDNGKAELKTLNSTKHLE